MNLVGMVVSHLEGLGSACALIGGAALAVHGVARSTEDVDLLVVDRRVLDHDAWRAWPGPHPPEISKGDVDDPLAGVVRIREGEDAVDVVVGKDAWMSSIIERRIWIDVSGERIPVVDAADLILTKLAAGGPQDLLDVRLLLAHDGALRAKVVDRMKELPGALKRAWKSLGPEAGKR